jgi:hypothetical protein
MGPRKVHAKSSAHLLFVTDSAPETSANMSRMTGHCSNTCRAPTSPCVLNFTVSSRCINHTPYTRVTRMVCVGWPQPWTKYSKFGLLLTEVSQRSWPTCYTTRIWEVVRDWSSWQMVSRTAIAPFAESSVGQTGSSTRAPCVAGGERVSQHVLPCAVAGERVSQHVLLHCALLQLLSVHMRAGTLHCLCACDTDGVLQMCLCVVRARQRCFPLRVAKGLKNKASGSYLECVQK